MRIHTLSSSFYRHFFFSLLIFSRILTSHSVQYTVYTKTVYVYTYTHTHTLHNMYLRFFGPPNTQSDTELFIGKLHRTSASGIYILLFFFFYIYFYFIRFKNTAAAVCAYYIIMYYTQCDRIIIIYI